MEVQANQSDVQEMTANEVCDDQRIANLSFQDESLPEFRSATSFPVSPSLERLPDLYPECLAALQQANQARALLRQRMEAKKSAISQIQTAIQDLERDLAVEAQARVRLHAMNQQLLGALQDMESLVEGVEEVVRAGHQTQRTRLGGLIEKLKQLVRAWRQLKQGRKDSLLLTMQSKSSGGENA